MAKHPDMTSSTSKVDWPETLVPLVVPKEWQPQTNNNNDDDAITECVYLYDRENNLLKLVDKNNHDTIIDLLDPDDIIGVSVEVNALFDTTTTTTTTGSSNPRVVVADDDNDKKEKEDRPSNAPPTDTLVDTQGHAVLTIYAYPRRDPNHPNGSDGGGLLRWCGMGHPPHPKPNLNYKRPTNLEECSKFGHRYAFHRHLKVVPSEDMGPLNALVQAIRQASGISSETNTTTSRGRALVIVNPKSGPKQNAEEVYDNVVNVLLEQAGIEHDLIVTNKPKHPTEIMSKGYHEQHKITDYSMLISVGGDGIAHECLQGLRCRDDWKEILDNMTIGFVGAGTSNGMAKSIARASGEQSSPLDATYLIVKGYSRSTDMSEYNTTTNTYWSFLTYSWAWIAAIDVDSEVLRSLGSLRFDLWGVYEVLRMRKFRAKFSYLPANKPKPSGGALPSLADDVSKNKEEGWITEEDDFYIFWASHVSDAAENTLSSPPSKIDDGIFQIWVTRAKNASRLSMVKVLLSMENGGHVGLPGVEFIECHAYRLEPVDGINDLDGEVVESGPIQGRVLPGALKIFCK